MIAEWILTGALGLAVGNYATTFVYRLPRGESAFSKHPYCGGCGTMLGVKDLFPAVSWLMLRGQCRHCGMKIPSVYFWVEVFCAVLFIAAMGLNHAEGYLPVVAGATCVVALWGMEVRTGKLFYSVLMLAAALGVIYRTLVDGTLYPALYGIFWGAGVPMVIWRLGKGRQDISGREAQVSIPHHIALGATAGAWFTPHGLAVFALLWLAGLLVYRGIARIVPRWPGNLHMVPFMLAFSVLLVNPQLIPAVWEWIARLSG